MEAILFTINYQNNYKIYEDFFIAIEKKLFPNIFYNRLEKYFLALQ